MTRRPPSTKVTIFKMRVANTFERFIRDLGLTLLILLGFFLFMGILAFIKFGVCYYEGKSPNAWACFKMPEVDVGEK